MCLWPEQFLYYLYGILIITVPKGTLYLIPVPLGETDLSGSIPAGVSLIVTTLRHFIVEELRSARRYLRKTDPLFPIDDSFFTTLNEHTRENEIEGILNEALKGTDIGLMSESGLPGIADPGARVVLLAHKLGIKVKPLPGPSSILLALISSGLNGQAFTFHGYLPVKPGEREKKIRGIEVMSKSGVSQVFIETPYRNSGLLEDLIRICKPATKLCIAAGLTTQEEFIFTCPVGEWKLKDPPVAKIPAVFILLA